MIESLLEQAISRLHDFRHGWDREDIIDDDSGLTPADLDEILGYLSRVVSHNNSPDGR